MGFQTVTLQLPETIYQLVRRTAKAVKRPMKEVLVTILKSSLPSLEGVPPEITSELTKLEYLSDKQLWAAARGTLPRPQQRRLSSLLRKNQAGKLAKAEQQALDELISQSERLMLRKARAYALLKWRGYAPTAVVERSTT
jgi:hypothetical protein